MAQDEHEHSRWGMELEDEKCGECGRSTVVAMTFMTNPSVPNIVQARCPNLTCTWKGQIREVPF